MSLKLSRASFLGPCMTTLKSIAISRQLVSLHGTAAFHFPLFLGHSLLVCPERLPEDALDIQTSHFTPVSACYILNQWATTVHSHLLHIL